MISRHIFSFYLEGIKCPLNISILLLLFCFMSRLMSTVKNFLDYHEISLQITDRLIGEQYLEKLRSIQMNLPPSIFLRISWWRAITAWKKSDENCHVVLSKLLQYTGSLQLSALTQVMASSIFNFPKIALFLFAFLVLWLFHWNPCFNWYYVHGN